MTSRLAAELHLARLLRMLAGVEEAIIRLEDRANGDRERMVGRLRVVQDEIETALRRLER